MYIFLNQDLAKLASWSVTQSVAQAGFVLDLLASTAGVAGIASLYQEAWFVTTFIYPF